MTYEERIALIQYNLSRAERMLLPDMALGSKDTRIEDALKCIDRAKELAMKDDRPILTTPKLERFVEAFSKMWRSSS